MSNNNNTIFDIERLKRKAWDNINISNNNNDNFFASRLHPSPPFPPPPLPPRHRTGLNSGDHLVEPNVVPSVTVVLEGRSICQRVNLHHHSDYKSLAKALRRMFANTIINNLHHHGYDDDDDDDDELDLSNAVPGHLVAYEDLEDDLLLVGDLKWKDFVRVAKRIRILPAKPKSISRNQNK